MAEERNSPILDGDVNLANASAHCRRTRAGPFEELSPAYQRLLGFAGEVEKQQGPMGELKHALLRGHRQRQDDPQGYIAAPYPSFLLCQGTFAVGKESSFGPARARKNLYVQSVVDAHCSLAFARLYPSNSAATAVDILQTSVLPFYEQQGVKVERLLTDDSKAYGRRPGYLYQVTLALAGIEHLRCESIPAASDNPFCAQFHRILEEEFFSPKLRQDFHWHLDILQRGLDAFLKDYNCRRECPGARTGGRTPFRAFLDALEARRGCVAAAS